MKPWGGVMPKPAMPTDAEIVAAYDDTFEAARSRFRNTCRRYGLKTSDWPIGKGADTICVAHFGSRNARRKLIVISGVHGIEGYCGSAAQITFIDRYAAARPDIHILLVHIVNPAGMRHFRRTTDDNVDLNRNLVSDHALLARADADSKAVCRLFSDRHLSGLPGFLWVPAMLAGLQRIGGLEKMRSALAGGQFFDPEALFYGGTCLAAELKALFAAFDAEFSALSETQTLFFDLHSGIGRFGQCSLLANGRSEIAPSDIYGVPVSPGHEGANAVYPVHGDVIRGLKARLGIPGACAVTFECGTGSVLSTLLALRDANTAQVHYPDSPARVRRAKARMLRAFCPANDHWRAAYVRAAHGFLDRALSFLSSVEGGHVR